MLVFATVSVLAGLLLQGCLEIDAPPQEELPEVPPHPVVPPQDGVDEL